MLQINEIEQPLDVHRTCEKYIVYNTITKRVDSSSREIYTKSLKSLSFDNTRKTIFDFLKTNIQNDVFLNNQNLEIFYVNNHNIIDNGLQDLLPENDNIIHPRIFCIRHQDFKIKLILLNNDTDDKVDPFDNFTHLNTYLFFLNLSDYLTDTIIYLDKIWNELNNNIQVCILTQINYNIRECYLKQINENRPSYNYKLNLSRLISNMTEYFSIKLKNIILKNPLFANINSDDDVIMQFCIKSIVNSLPIYQINNYFDTNPDDMTQNNSEWNHNIKLASVVKLINDENIRMIDFKNKYKNIDGIIKITWLDLNNIFINISQDTRTKHLLFIYINNLTMIYIELTNKIKSFEQYVTKYKRSILPTVISNYFDNVNEEPKIQHKLFDMNDDLNKNPIDFKLKNTNISSEQDIIMEFKKTDKNSMIQKLIKWNYSCYMCNRKTDFLINIWDVVSLINYNDTDSDNAKIKKFYFDKFIDYKKKYQYITTNNISRTNMFSIKLFIMLSDDITLLQKNILINFQNCVDNFNNIVFNELAKTDALIDNYTIYDALISTLTQRRNFRN